MTNNDHNTNPPHIQKNRALWEATSDEYEQKHAADLAGYQQQLTSNPAPTGKNAMSWGVWRIPEQELQILGDVAGKDILELGCGAARWSIALAQHGARPVGIDFSSKQLQHARRLMNEAGVNFPLIEASAEDVPLPDASFDIVFCDWGAMTFCDPQRTVPEAARLLRPGGIFAFMTSTPIAMICHNMQTDQVERTLVHDYFGLTHLEWPDEVDFQLPYGEWIRLFRRAGFLIEDLVEIQPPIGSTSSYRNAAETEWSRRWPMENIWKVRKTQG